MKTIRECLIDIAQEGYRRGIKGYGMVINEKQLNQALASIREMVEGKKKYLIDNLDESEDVDEMVEINNKIDSYNQAIEDILEMLK